MDHTIEPASSGRAKCRGCGNKIGKGELRFGERMPNPFSDGSVMTHWFHPKCAALKRPDAFLETTLKQDTVLDSAEVVQLTRLAKAGLEHRRLPRIDSVQRSPSGRARCRQCREPIAKGDWRIGLVFHEEGMFNPAGYIHLTCSGDYLGTSDILERLCHFAPGLSDSDVKEIQDTLAPTGA